MVANGELVAAAAAARASVTWVYEQVEPMATYLATVQIGRYELRALRRRRRADARGGPGRRRRRFDDAFGGSRR